MTFEPGQVVTLKSGGLPMTVAAAEDDEIDCIWIGEDGEMFRQKIPAVALIAVDSDGAHDDEDHDEDEHEDHDEEDAHDGDEDDDDKKKSKAKRKVA